MRRFLLQGALLYALVLWGLISLRGPVLLLALPLLLTIAAALLFGPDPPRLRITRSISVDRACEGQPVMVSLTVLNEGGRLDEVLIHDPIPDGLRVIEGQHSLLTTLRAGQTVALRYTLSGVRGVYSFGDLRVTARDVFDLVRHQVSISPQSAQMLTVLPDVVRLRRIAIRPRQTRVYAGSIPANIGGPGVEFFGVRGYQPSDALRHINWRASARLGSVLFSNEYQQERVADIGLIIDARQRSNIVIGDFNLFEHTVRAAAALADAFLTDGNRVGMLVYGRSLDWTPPGYGKQQRERILRSLARAETGISQVFDRLYYLPTQFFPARSQIILLGPLVADDLPVLVRMRGQGYELLVVSPSPVSFEAGFLGNSPETILAARIAQIERHLLLRKLRQTGVRVVDWDVREPLAQAVYVSLARQPLVARTGGVIR